MHRNTAQFVCRLGFVLCCLLPTCVTGGWIAYRSFAGVVLSQKQEWEHVLSQRLGLRVTCEALDYSQPNAAELKNVALFDPETGVPIATLALLEVIREEKQWKLIGWQAVVESAQLPQVMQVLQQRLLKMSATDALPCAIWLREITLRDAERSLTLVDLNGTWQSTKDGPLGGLQFRLPEAEPNAPRGRIVVQRNRQTSPPSTRWQFESGALPLPCSLAAPGWRDLRHLGIGATFLGQLELVDAGEQSSGRLRGTFEHVDLDALISEQFAHQLSGLAICKIEDATLEQNRLTMIRGTVQARDGWISRSLLQAATEHLQLHCPVAETLPASGAPVSYRQLSLGFDLRDGGLQLSGSADPLRAGVLLATGSGSILETPPRHQATSLGFVRMLVPESEWQVPAARPAQALARFLPLPELQNGATISRSHVPTRLNPPRNPDAPVIRQPYR
ncbi:hypothetical protein ETAA8_43130 [Anatilimnocola aggregata]|uniref:Uncharacterized protein n=1 Tax=Anatilimnocola aggregata TaxID=2528021 RepID=A0A517YG53_9BACT|nr:hypothetical protein [Anatilimnocola aggregata]QDU29206.1 hypothetical protein ETAA8_43130 [Anatilimnocola aggregata]